MKVLVIFSGSQGHFQGVKRFLDFIKLNEELFYASNIGMPEYQQKNIRYVHLNASPAFLDYEFLHHENLKKIIQLKSDQFYYHNRKMALGQLIDSIKPDVIILDNHSFTDALIIAELYRNSILKIIFYQTRLSTDLTKGSHYGGYKGKDLKFLPAKQIMKSKKLRLWRKKLTMPGMNENHRIQTLIKSLDFQTVELNRKRHGLDSLSFIPEIILSGADLSFYQVESQFYSGLCLPESSSMTDIGGEKMKIPSRLKDETVQVLVSSGSRSHTYTDFGTFLDGIQTIINHFTGITFYLPQNLREKISGDNISYYKWDTYHDHLAQAVLHITHGGINSIKDSLSLGVPMLICPLDWRSDQIHNALMFEKLGLAHAWNVKKDSLEDVKKKVEELLGGDFKERIKEYVANDRERYPPDKVKAEFMELIKDKKWEVRNW